MSAPLTCVSGFLTVIAYTPGVTMSAALMVAVSCAALTKVVVRSLPAH